MAKITFKEIADFFEEGLHADVIDMEQVGDSKLYSAVYEFARTRDDAELYRRILQDKVSVMVNGEAKHPDTWAYIRVDDSTEITISPALRGEDAGRIGIIVGVALIAIGIGILASPIASKAFLGLSESLLWGTIAGSLIITGAGMALSGVAAKYFAPDLPGTPEKDEETTKTYSWSGIKSLARTGVPMPLLIGTHRLGGYIISLFTRARGNDSYLYMLLAISEGEIEGLCQHDDYTNAITTSNRFDVNYKDPAVFINEQPERNYTGVRWWFRNGLNLQDATKDQYDPTAQNIIPNFSDVRIQYDDGRDLVTLADGGIVYTTHTVVDRIEISLVAPSLYVVNQDPDTAEETPLLDHYVEYRLEYKKSSLPDFPQNWTTHTGTVSRASAQCLYAEVNNQGVITCGINAGTATKELCNNKVAANQHPCWNQDTATHSYSTQTFLNSVNYFNGQEYFSGLNKPSLVRVRITDIKEVATGTTARQVATCSSSTGKVSILKRVVTFEIWQNGAVRSEVVDINQVHIPDKYLMCKSELKEYEEEHGSYWDWHWITSWVSEVYWPTTFTYDFGGFKVTLNSPSTWKTYTYSNTNARRNYEFVFYSLETDAEEADWHRVGPAASRDPIYKWDEIDVSDSPDIYDIRLYRNGDDSEDPNLADTVKLHSVSEIVEDSLIYPNTALFGIEMLATNQLSGSPPNITLAAKGLKVEVPDVSSGNFEDCFWSEDNNRFENYAGSEVGWDGTTLITEYTANPAAHMRNIMLNERYGIGRYFNSGDINVASWVETIKDCHLIYDSYANEPYDWAGWWKGLSDDEEWSKRVEITPNTTFHGILPDTGQQGSVDTIAKDPAGRKVYSLAINGYDQWAYDLIQFYFRIKLEKPLEMGVEYTFEFTFQYETNPEYVSVRITHIADKIVPGKNPATHLFESDNETFTNHVISVSATATIPGITNLTFNIFSEAALASTPVINLFGELSDISIVPTQTNHAHFHSANGVVESSQAVDTFFTEFSHSFRMWLIALASQLYFKSNKDESPIHQVSDANIISSSFEQTFTSLASIPYLLDGQFSNQERDYEMSTRTAIVPMVEANKASRKPIGLKYVTELAKIERELKFQSNLLVNCNHTVMFSLSTEHLHATAGDVIDLYHTLPDWGSGQTGRILSFSSGPQEITIDSAYTFSSISTYNFAILYLDDDNVMQEADIDESAIIEGQELSTVILQTWPADPATDSVYIIGIKDTAVKKFRLLDVRRTEESQVKCRALIHVPEVYTNEDVTVVEDPIPYRPPDDHLIVIDSFEAIPLYGTALGDGILFKISAGGQNIDSFTIEYSESPDTGYTQLTTVDGGTYKTSTYYTNNLIKGLTYYFRCYGKNSIYTSKYRYYSVKITEAVNNPFMLPPTSVRLQGEDPNNNTFNSRDLSIEWNPVNIAGSSSYVEIAAGLAADANSVTQWEAGAVLRSATVFDPKYVYSFADNFADNGGKSTGVVSNFLVRVATISSDGKLMSPFSNVYTFTNQVPANVDGLASLSMVGGVSFTWDNSTEEDHKCYLVQTQVETDQPSSWFEHVNNDYIYQLSSSEVTKHGSNATVYVRVRDKDVFNQLSSSTAETSAQASGVGDSIFGFAVTVNIGSGQTTELYNGDFTSGGVTIG